MANGRFPWLEIGGAALAGAGIFGLAKAFGGGGLGGGPATVFTIVFENRDRSQVASSPTFAALSARYLDLTNYVSRLHPSLPNYIVMAAGQTFGISDDLGFVIDSPLNIAEQMRLAGVPWRAYGESMPRPGYIGDTNLYAQRHMPFGYFRTAREDNFADHVVPLDRIVPDLAANRYRYVWITPNLVSDMHDAPVATGDAWLAQVLPQLMASPGYRNGGVIFVLFDEGSHGYTLPAWVVSERLRTPGQPDATPYGHVSYLAAVQDLLGLPRLPATAGAPSLAAVLR